MLLGLIYELMNMHVLFEEVSSLLNCSCFILWILEYGADSVDQFSTSVPLPLRISVHLVKPRFNKTVP